MKRFPTPIASRRLRLDAPHASEATVPMNIRLYRRTPATWRFACPDPPVLAPPFPTWTRETLLHLLTEVASWRPVADEPVMIRVELVGWRWQTSARYPRLIMETSTWRARIALEQHAVSEDAGLEGFTFEAPMLAVFEELHARSPFVVSTTGGVSINAQQEHERPIGDPPDTDERDDEDEDDDENDDEPEDDEEVED